MSVDSSTVLRMAALARLSVPEDKLDSVAAEMESILAFMGRISAFEGSEYPDPEPAVRRSDTPREQRGSAAFQREHIDASGAVIVPSVKGAS